MKAPAQNQETRQTDTARIVPAQQATEEAVFVDSRPIAAAQRQLGEMANNNPRAMQQRALAERINNGPGMVAQRQKIAQLFGGVPTGPAHAANPKANNTGLPDRLKSGIENLSGYSMDDVKVHYNSTAPAQLQAHAYAQGSEIHLAPGQERHLPHEAWHVVQQKQGRVQPTMQMKGRTINDAAGLEHEADVMGAQASMADDGVAARSFVGGSEDRAAPSAATPAAAGAPVQRVTAQILPTGEENGIIGEIAIAGRPRSAHSGTMGDHSTAFTTLQVGLETQLAGLSLREASVFIAGLGGQLTRLPGWSLRDTMPTAQRERLDEAMEQLHEAIAHFRRWRREGAKRRQEAELDMIEDEKPIKLDTMQEEDPGELYEDRNDEFMEGGGEKEWNMDEEKQGRDDDSKDEIRDDELIEDEGEDEEEVDYDDPDGAQVGWMQSIVEYYLEARELIPLSTINTKALNAALAGKGKGENAGALAQAEMYAKSAREKKEKKEMEEEKEKEKEKEDEDEDEDEEVQPVDDDALCRAALSLFDARAAAVVGAQNDQEILNVVAPGVTTHSEGDERVDMMIKQHMLTLESFFPNAIEQLRSNKKLGLLVDAMWKAVYAKHEENQEASKGEKVDKEKGGKRPERKRYVTAGIWVDNDGLIERVNIDGRPKSPFSGTMGAHTTAFIVYKDLLVAALVGKTLPAGAAALLQLIANARNHLAASMALFPADSKQLHAVNGALDELALCERQLAGFEGTKEEPDEMSGWDQVVELQEGVVRYIEILNSTPGATLDVADINGKREGAHRAVLLDEASSPEARYRSILGLLDMAGVEGYLKNAWQGMEGDPDVKDYRKKYLEKNKSAHEDGKLPKPSGDLGQAALHLIRHHLQLISAAYPGALADTGLDVDADDQTLLKLCDQTLLYSKEDAEIYKDVETEED